MSNNILVDVAAAAAAPQPKKLSQKVAGLVEKREAVRAALGEKLGKGARVANVAHFLALPEEQRNLNAFATQILERNAAQKAARNAKKAGEKEAKKAAKMMGVPQLPVILEEANNRKTSKAKAKPKGAAAASRAAAVTKKNRNNSVERQAKKLVKEMEAVEAKLRPVGLDAATVCDVQRRMETAGVDGKQVLKLCKSFLTNE